MTTRVKKTGTKDNEANPSSSEHRPSKRAKACPAARAAGDSTNADRERALTAVGSAFSEIDGYAIARAERERQRAEGTFVGGLQYGEVLPLSFASVLDWMQPEPGEHFYDLGSGTGVAVLTASALFNLGSAVGIEIQHGLHAAALQARDSLARAAPRNVLRTPSDRVRFECGDALAAHWQDADLVFCSTTCFTPEMLETFVGGVRQLRPGARIAVTTRALELGGLRLVQRGKLPYGKGTLLFFVYCKT